MRVLDTPYFTRSLKRLGKKYASLKAEIRELERQLLETPTLGTGIGHSCYKIRLAVASKGGGKRGGARVITYVQVVGETVFLLALYDKAEQGTIRDRQVLELLGLLEG